MKFREERNCLLTDEIRWRKKGSHHQYRQQNETRESYSTEHGGDLNMDTVNRT